ncbi:hypothetical protein MTO96_017845 [Rhipicephalus appendiculatus]
MADVPKTFEGLRDHVISEQFLRCCSQKLAIFLKERECKTLTSLADTADRFLEAQGINNIGKVTDEAKNMNKSTIVSQTKQQSICFFCNRKGHKAHECREAIKESEKCKSCGQPGHKTADCKNKPEKQVSCVVIERDEERESSSAAEPMRKTCAAIECRKTRHKPPRVAVDSVPVVQGRVLGQVAQVLRDTGSNTTIVRRDLVPDRCLTGETRKVMLVDGNVKQLPEARISVHTPYLIGDINALCMSNTLYDLVLGNIPGVKEPHEPDPDWEYPDLSAKASAANQVPSCRGKLSRVSAVPKTKNGDLSSQSTVNKCCKQGCVKNGVVEKSAGGFANKRNDGGSKSSLRGTMTQPRRLLCSAARVTTTATCTKAKASEVNEESKTASESATLMGVQRRQPSKQPKCRYGRKCFRRDAQHLKQFRHPKLSYYEASLRDEGENRHEDESKDRADGRTITAELQENVIDIEVNGKWDHYDKPEQVWKMGNVSCPPEHGRAAEERRRPAHLFRPAVYGRRCHPSGALARGGANAHGVQKS